MRRCPPPHLPRYPPPHSWENSRREKGSAISHHKKSTGTLVSLFLLNSHRRERTFTPPGYNFEKGDELKMLTTLVTAAALGLAPTRTPLTARPARPRASILMQEGGKAENEEARMSKMYKPGDEDDPFQVERPKFGLAPATGRSTEMVYGADFPEPNDLMEWSEILRAQGVERLLFVHDGELSEELSSYVAALSAMAGFAADAVTAVDVLADGAAQRTAEAMQAAATARAKIAVHGGPFTLVLAQWVLTDYIGSENCEEACDVLRSRSRSGGVNWALRNSADDELIKEEALCVARFLGLEDGGASPTAPPPPPPSEPTGPVKVSKGGILFT
jgi:hypothetical protein